MEGHFDEVQDEYDAETQGFKRMFKYQIESDPIEINQTVTQAWRRELKAGDMIDVSLKLPRSRNDYAWVQAKIISVYSVDFLQLDFIYDNWQIKKIINKWSIKIEQFGTYTKDLYEQRDKLKQMMLVDAHDQQTWYRSIIFDIQERSQVNNDNTVKMAFIGFRVYCYEGDKTDKLGVYKGWSSRFDEWIPLYSQRIRPFL
ncbi:UNKNOWN [Stylonychia lemnae]|uniref:Uncharacterized protein n=1 Tax=Stylonychia lemnae TaxID=5949 RepID=A0A078B1P4_STYLE|nr:UNKNOWN [Stylonychia lemnae]|eukprot:CDW88221.1 UNKNOWN [Stylonychia lemnae]